MRCMRCVYVYECMCVYMRCMYAVYVCVCVFIDSVVPSLLLLGQLLHDERLVLQRVDDEHDVLGYRHRRQHLRGGELRTHTEEQGVLGSEMNAPPLLFNTGGGGGEEVKVDSCADTSSLYSTELARDLWWRVWWC